MKTREGKWVRYPPLRCYLEKGIAKRYGGVSRTGLPRSAHAESTQGAFSQRCLEQLGSYILRDTDTLTIEAARP